MTPEPCPPPWNPAVHRGVRCPEFGPDGPSVQRDLRASEKFLHAFPQIVLTASAGDLLSDDGRDVDDSWSDRFGHLRESVGRKRPDRSSHGWCGGRLNRTPGSGTND